VVALAGVFSAAEGLTPEQIDTRLGQVVDRLPDAIRNNLERRTKWIEQWFDAEMERLQAAYRSRIRWYAGFVGLVLVLVMGLDSIDLATELYREPARRQVVVAAAQEQVAADGDVCPGDEPAEPDPLASAQQQLRCTETLVGSIDGLDVSRWTDGPGWPSGRPKGLGAWITMVLGLGASVAALAAGAPWWFSVLKRLMGLRGGAKAET
jgi:hypothetical protein